MGKTVTVAVLAMCCWMQQIIKQHESMGSFNSIINICIYECAKEYISMCTYLHMWATLPLYNSIHGTILYHLDSFTVLSYVFMHAHCFLGHV